jgi:hypothetical protein
LAFLQRHPAGWGARDPFPRLLQIAENFALLQLHVVKGRMGRQAVVVVLYVLALVTVVVGVDVLFFRNRFWERLMVNVGIVLVFWAFYLRLLKRP